MAVIAGMSGGAQAAQGLNGAYYSVDSIPNDLADAASLIAGKTPDATFIANTICFPADCSGPTSDHIPLNTFLAGSASSISDNAVSDLTNHVLTLSGFLSIADTGTYSFSLLSDDGSSLMVDGNTIISNDGPQSFGGGSADYALTAGLHTIRILQFEGVNNTGLAVSMNGTPLGGDFIRTTGAVPEPAMWVMMISGFGLVGAAMRHRDKPALRLA
jgi:hypothetical protein